jgi:hypothetical protein
MIDRDLLKRGANGGRKPEKAVRRSLEAGDSRVPAVAALPAALGRAKVGLPKPVSGEPLLLPRHLLVVGSFRHRKLRSTRLESLTFPRYHPGFPALSRRLIAAGFEITGRHTFTVLNWTPKPDSYSQQTVGFIKPMREASDAFTKEDWATRIADQKATADAGEYMFSLNRSIFSAANPETAQSPLQGHQPTTVVHSPAADHGSRLSLLCSALSAWPIHRAPDRLLADADRLTLSPGAGPLCS